MANLIIKSWLVVCEFQSNADAAEKICLDADSLTENLNSSRDRGERNPYAACICQLYTCVEISGSSSSLHPLS